MRPLRKKSPGNAITEYALPAILIVVAAGLLVSMLNLNGLLGDFFRGASGKTAANMDGTTFRVSLDPQTGATGNGQNGFDHSLARKSMQGETIGGNGNELAFQDIHHQAAAGGGDDDDDGDLIAEVVCPDGTVPVYTDPNHDDENSTDEGTCPDGLPPGRGGLGAGDLPGFITAGPPATSGPDDTSLGDEDPDDGEF